MSKLQKTKKKAARVILILLILITALILSINFSLAENDLLIRPDYIKILIESGETETKFLNIENSGTKKVDLHLEIRNKKNFMYIGDNDKETTIEILPGQTKAVKITISPPLGTEPDLYITQIIYEGEGIKEITPLVVEVMCSKCPLLDVDLKMQSEFQEVLGGKNIQGEITLINRNSGGRIPVKITYSLKDSVGNKIISKEENVTVETKLNIIRELILPEYLREGIYIFDVVAKYNSQVGTSSRVFEVVEEKGIAAVEEAEVKLGISGESIIWGLLIIFILFFIATYYIHRKLKRIEEH